MKWTSLLLSRFIVAVVLSNRIILLSMLSPPESHAKHAYLLHES